MKKNNDVRDRPQTVSEQHVLSTLEVIVDVIATAVISDSYPNSDNNNKNRHKIIVISRYMFTKFQVVC